MGLYWEFELGFIFNKLLEIIEMYSKVGYFNFIVMYDMSHVYMCVVVGLWQYVEKEMLLGGIEELLVNLEGKIGAIYLIDFDGGFYDNYISIYNFFGIGDVDFKFVLLKLLVVFNIEYWVIDMCFWFGLWELVELLLAFVKNFIKDVEVGSMVS